jgi:hypothetical protein
MLEPKKEAVIKSMRFLLTHLARYFFMILCLLLAIEAKTIYVKFPATFIYVFDI